MTDPLVQRGYQVILICAAALVLLLSGCSASDSHYRVSAEEFLEASQQPISSFQAYDFVGATTDRAYLRVWSGMTRLIGGGHHIYSVSLDE
jgi:hypothetical protein